MNFFFKELLRYDHMVRHFDTQLLSQLKDRTYEVLNLSLDDKENEDTFIKRIAKIENTVYLRNRYHFEFVDNKLDFEKANLLFSNETSLAVRDGLLTDIGNGEQNR